MTDRTIHLLGVYQGYYLEQKMILDPGQVTSLPHYGLYLSVYLVFLTSLNVGMLSICLAGIENGYFSKIA